MIFIYYAIFIVFMLLIVIYFYMIKLISPIDNFFLLYIYYIMDLEKFLGEKYPSIYHLVVTGKCNASCEGCINTLIYGERPKVSSLWEESPDENLRALKFLINHLGNGQPIYIAFYGGEPLLVPERLNFYIKEMSQSFPEKTFYYLLFTNGMLLDRFIEDGESFLGSLSLLIVSIDGRKLQHNRVRKGTDLEKIEENLRAFKKVYKIPVLMWSTIRENMSLRDCYLEFLKLYKERLTDYFFWHLVEERAPIKNFENFRVTYLEDLSFLFEEFVSHIKAGQILPLLPLCELFFFLLKGIRRGHTGCGIEKLRNFDILSGKILPCVDLGEEISFKDPGKIKELKGNLERLVNYKEEFGCADCLAEFYCGGRCPVLIKTSPLRAKQYCLLMRDFVELARSKIEELKRALVKSSITAEELYFPYGYLVLLTDVVP